MFILGDDYPTVRDHVGEALEDGYPSTLSRRSPSWPRGWLNSHKGAGKAYDGGSGTQCDEYPWAASMEGGEFGAVSLKSVDQKDNGGAGSQLRWFHERCKVPANDTKFKYKVVVVKGLPETGYICNR